MWGALHFGILVWCFYFLLFVSLTCLFLCCLFFPVFCRSLISSLLKVRVGIMYHVTAVNNLSPTFLCLHPLLPSRHRTKLCRGRCTSCHLGSKSQARSVSRPYWRRKAGSPCGGTCWQDSAYSWAPQTILNSVLYGNLCWTRLEPKSECGPEQVSAVLSGGRVVKTNTSCLSRKHLDAHLPVQLICN